MKTKFKIVETEDYILAVSDEEIEASELVLGLYPDFSQIRKSLPKSDNLKKIKDKSVFKIIAYKPKGDAKELDLPLLPQIVIEDDGEKLMYDAIQKARGNDFQTFYKLAAKNCYEVHKSATKVYSEEDIRRIAQFAFSFHRRNDLDDNELEIEFNRLLDKNIQSLKQPKTPKWFIAEMETRFGYHSDKNQYVSYEKDKLKTETNSQGKTYLVGTYE